MAEVDKYDSLETRVSGLEVRMAVAENNITEINRKLDKIDKGVNSIIWLFVGTIILAVLNLIIKGGVQV